MEYQYEMDVYGHSMAMSPDETKKGTITLVDRPMIGEEIEVDG
ncbi:MAG TPA: hypothetical protein VJG85_01070 [Patescibacteria group bacterium]|nr:hypothetical protein [Patescibacteria group bacterium]